MILIYGSKCHLCSTHKFIHPQVISLNFWFCMICDTSPRFSSSFSINLSINVYIHLNQSIDYLIWLIKQLPKLVNAQVVIWLICFIHICHCISVMTCFFFEPIYFNCYNWFVYSSSNEGRKLVIPWTTVKLCYVKIYGNIWLYKWQNMFRMSQRFIKSSPPI